MSGHLFMDQVRASNAELLPVDSEHNALFQCMPEGFLPGREKASSVEKILLTASGGPFRTLPLEQFEQVTPEQACAHPNWDMGRKISVDSATMMNKGLEVIEACWLFGLEVSDVQVVFFPYPSLDVHRPAGLLPAFEAARCGKRILLANKEALVMSGHLFMDQVRASNAELLPVDSEHNALFQCMPEGFLPGREKASSVEKILLTASGGPFRTLPLEQFEQVTPEQACAHPNWDMGRKISVDSATMMNKGLEVIEACWLFGLEVSDVQVVLHPQSIIHSMVQYTDGSVLGELGLPDMRTPIAHAMAWPERIASGVGHLDLFSVARLDFQPADFDRFPCLSLAYQAWEAGGTAATVMNAANEIAVEAFLDKNIRFTDIATVIEKTLERCGNDDVHAIDTLLQADAAARLSASELVQQTERPVLS